MCVCVCTSILSPCSEDGAQACNPRPGAFECICNHGYHGEFCQDVDPEPPFIGSTVNLTVINATTGATDIDAATVAYETVISTSK